MSCVGSRLRPSAMPILCSKNGARSDCLFVPQFCSTIEGMAAISVRELSHETSRTLRRVKAGETIEITERGKVIGRIVPAAPSDDVRARLLAQGRLEPASGRREALLASLERRLAVEPVDSENAGTAALVDIREGERY